MAKILLVEDEEKLARFVELELTHEGYQVDKAFDGRTGLDMAESGKHDPEERNEPDDAEDDQDRIGHAQTDPAAAGLAFVFNRFSGITHWKVSSSL